MFQFVNKFTMMKIIATGSYFPCLSLLKYFYNIIKRRFRGTLLVSSPKTKTEVASFIVTPLTSLPVILSNINHQLFQPEQLASTWSLFN